MHTIKDLQELVIKAISEQSFTRKPIELYEPVSYLMNLGGKRLRPVLLLMATDLFRGNINEAIKPALAIEVFHNFTLMHDDIMDKAPLRRGNPTVHAKWNEAIAILSGDVMLIEAYKLLINVNPAILPNVLNVFNDTAVGVCEGQQIDMNFEKREKVTIDEYLEMIKLKTAVLLGGALEIGALIGNAPVEDAQHLYDFGVNLGIAFQLQDDILDVYGDPEKFGKQVGGDIISNKKTFLLIKAQELANIEQAARLKSMLTSENISAEQKINQVTAIYNELNIRQTAEKAMTQFAEKGIAALNNIQVPSERKIILQEFVDMLMIREH